MVHLINGSLKQHGFFISHMNYPAAACTFHVHMAVAACIPYNLVWSLSSCTAVKSFYNPWFHQRRHKPVNGTFSGWSCKIRILVIASTISSIVYDELRFFLKNSINSFFWCVWYVAKTYPPVFLNLRITLELYRLYRWKSMDYEN